MKRINTSVLKAVTKELLTKKCISYVITGTILMFSSIAVLNRIIERFVNLTFSSETSKKIISYILLLIIFSVLDYFVFQPILNFFFFEKKLLKIPLDSKLLKITNLLFSSKNNTEVFEPILIDWQEEYFEALSKKEIWKARWINVRYTYAFLAAMWMKSPIGDLIQFVIKIAKQ